MCRIESVHEAGKSLLERPESKATVRGECLQTTLPMHGCSFQIGEIQAARFDACPAHATSTGSLQRRLTAAQAHRSAAGSLRR